VTETLETTGAVAPAGRLAGAGRSRRAVIISYAPITDAPRVRRQAKLLVDRGWKVTLAGVEGRAPPPPRCELVVLERRFRRRTYVDRALYAGALLASRASGQLAEWVYWQNTIRQSLYAQLEGVVGDLVMCHDYVTLPPALRVAARTAAPLLLDAHEYARGQYMERPFWRYVHRPWVHRLQRTLFAKLDGITTVCDGIADLLKVDNALPDRPTVVRSMPCYQRCDFRPCGDTLTVLYHGILSPPRRLELLIESVPMWRKQFRLVLRGPGPDEYVDRLRRLARRLGVVSRVVIEKPVLFEDLIAAANHADIGLFVQGDWSPQKRFALPNKFFEYVMAGLALCVSDLPEMARLLRQHRIGRLVPKAEPQVIAETINAFDREQVEAFKRCSLVAAKQLCWEHESEKLARLVDRVMQHRTNRIASVRMDR